MKWEKGKIVNTIFLSALKKNGNCKIWFCRNGQRSALIFLFYLNYFLKSTFQVIFTLLFYSSIHVQIRKSETSFVGYNSYFKFFLCCILLVTSRCERLSVNLQLVLPSFFSEWGIYLLNFFPPRDLISFFPSFSIFLYFPCHQLIRQSSQTRTHRHTHTQLFSSPYHTLVTDNNFVLKNQVWLLYTCLTSNIIKVTLKCRTLFSWHHVLWMSIWPFFFLVSWSLKTKRKE